MTHRLRHRMVGLTLGLVVSVIGSGAVSAQSPDGDPQDSSGPGAVSVAMFPGADPTGATDSIAAFQAALDTGHDVHVPRGTWTIAAGWIDMKTPGQRLSCDDVSTTITVRRPGANPSPALIIEPSAVRSSVSRCTIDHAGQQFLDTGPFVPLDALNRTRGTHTHDGLGNAVLIMADGATFSGVVLNGWDNCIGLGTFDLTTGRQTLGPVAPVVSMTTTRSCGIGRHRYVPDFHQGAGIDVLTAIGAVVSDSSDWYSYDGFWIDTSGGASAIFSHLTAYYTRISSPLFQGPDSWHVTPGGVAFYLSGATTNFDGSADPRLRASACRDCTAIKPMGNGLLIDVHGTGTLIDNLRIFDPGLECIWIRAGHHVLTNTLCVGPNAMAGQQMEAAGPRAPQTSAIQIDANATADASAPFWNTHVVFNGLTVTAKGAPAYSYALALGGHGGKYPHVTVRAGDMSGGTKGDRDVPPGSVLTDADQ